VNGAVLDAPEQSTRALQKLANEETGELRYRRGMQLRAVRYRYSKPRGK
jgi:hypothetical protein